jgi:hypothetical protein
MASKNAMKEVDHVYELSQTRLAQSVEVQGVFVHQYRGAGHRHDVFSALSVLSVLCPLREEL